MSAAAPGPGPVAAPAQALPLALLLILVPLVYIGSFIAFSYGTLDLLDGRWAVQLIGHLEGLDRTLAGLLGARSRLVWAALTLLFLLAMTAATGVGLLVLARRAGRHRWPVLGASVAIATIFGLVFWFLAQRQFAGCLFEVCGPTCAATSSGSPFLIIPYMGGVFCRLYDPAFVGFFWAFFGIAVPLQAPVNLLFFIAVLSLVVGPRGIADWNAAELRQRNSDFRGLLLIGSALLTLTVLMELTLWGWLAELAAGWPEVQRLHNLQIGSALFWGVCNTAMLLLTFAPIGHHLRRLSRALAISQCDAPDQSAGRPADLPALETWERDHGITLMGRTAWPQILALLAPLLTGAFAFLFESSLGGG